MGRPARSFPVDLHNGPARPIPAAWRERAVPFIFLCTHPSEIFQKSEVVTLHFWSGKLFEPRGFTHMAVKTYFKSFKCFEILWRDFLLFLFFSVNAVPGKQTMPSSSRPLILLKLDSSVCRRCRHSDSDEGGCTCAAGSLSDFALWALEMGESAAEAASLRLDCRSTSLQKKGGKKDSSANLMNSRSPESFSSYKASLVIVHNQLSTTSRSVKQPLTNWFFFDISHR